MEGRAAEEYEAPAVAAGEASAAGPAEVAVICSTDSLRVMLREGERAAHVAVLDYQPSVGDRVLVTRDVDGAAWIFGVVQAATVTPMLNEALEALTPPVRVHDRRGRLIFEYEPDAERALVHIPDGDLEVRVERGAFRVQARDGIEVDTEGSVAIGAARTVELSAAGGSDAAAQVRLSPGEVAMSSQLLTATAERARLLSGWAGLEAETLATQVGKAKHVVRVLDVRAGRIVERARDVYREVERLSQTRAGRLRLVAKKAAQFVGQNTLLKARDRMKVKGERIHLA